MAIKEKGVQPPPKDIQDEERFMMWFNDVFQNFPRVITYEQDLTPTSVGANTSVEQTFTVTGLATNGIVYINKPTLNAGIVIGGVRVSAKNTLAITFGNLTGGAITPTTESYKIVEIRR